MVPPAPGIVDLVDVRLEKEGGFGTEIRIGIHLLRLGSKLADNIVQYIIGQQILVPADAVYAAFIAQKAQRIPHILDPKLIVLIMKEGAAGTLHIGRCKIRDALHVFRPAQFRAVIALEAVALLHLIPDRQHRDQRHQIDTLVPQTAHYPLKRLHSALTRIKTVGAKRQDPAHSAPHVERIQPVLEHIVRDLLILVIAPDDRVIILGIRLRRPNGAKAQHLPHPLRRGHDAMLVVINPLLIGGNPLHPAAGVRRHDIHACVIDLALLHRRIVNTRNAHGMPEVVELYPCDVLPSHIAVVVGAVAPVAGIDGQASV